jgi:hypothetical protein
MYSDQDKARIFRQKFYGRQDVFGVKFYVQQEDGKQRGSYSPKCANIWSDRCHLKLRDGTRCDSCEIKQYVPVSDESVLRHIHGDDEIIHYTLLLDNTVKFFALDFDAKEHMEVTKRYTWAEVSRAQQQLKEWGIPTAAARSTTAGWHLYGFLDAFYPAYKVRSIMYELCERVGFMQNLRMGIKGLPEVFPKQSANSPSGIGNGIKPPCVEHRFSVGRNCFVDERNIVIGRFKADLQPVPAPVVEKGHLHLVPLAEIAEGVDDDSVPIDHVIEAQWNFLDTFPLVSVAQLDAVIEKEGIELIEEQQTSGPSRTYSTGMGNSRNSKWQPPLQGSIEKVLDGCAALRRVRDKALAGQVVSHQEGFSLFHMCMATVDGLDWFRKNVPGWGQNEQDWKQLEHSVDKNYRPHTCQKMRENGICLPKTQCFKPRPPTITVEGQQVTLHDAPEREWIQPSPVRYAFGKGEDFLKRLMEEALALKDVEDTDAKAKALAALAVRAMVFDEDQQKELKDFLKSNKVSRVGEIGKAFREGKAEATKEYKESTSKRDDILHIQGNSYKKDRPYGYSTVNLKDKTQKSISQTDFQIEEVKSYTDEGKVVKTVYLGTARTHGMERKFEVDSDTWEDNTEFSKYFGRLLSSGYNIIRQNLGGVRQAAMAFSIKAGIAYNEYLTTQGWYGNSYIMPSVVVDKDGVKPNTEMRLDLSNKAYARKYDFKILGDDEFMSAMMSIKTDMLNSWPRQWTTIGISHAMLPVTSHIFQLKQQPSLFFEGLTGAGKTELACALQWFWGNFDKVLNLKSSGNGAMYEAFECKDALLVLDDYKGLDKYQIAAVTDLFHYGYDRQESVKLNRDGTPRALKAVRATILGTGEQFISGEASIIARTILIETKRQDTTKTLDSYNRCQEFYQNYQGVTARFIHWILNADVSSFKPKLNDIRMKLQTEFQSRQNAARVAVNLAINHLTWQLWVEFMLHSGVVGPREQEELIAEHWHHIVSLAFGTIGNCENEQNGRIFAEALYYLIDTRQVSIKDLEGYVAEGKPQIGFIQSRDIGSAHIAFIHPTAAWEAVKNYLRNTNLVGTIKSIGRQLYEDGYLRTNKQNESTESVYVSSLKAQKRYWAMDLHKLGITTPLRVVGGTEPLPLGKVDDVSF